ncbi:DUF4129 domain-containing protein [Actinomyces timonensis]|uniref:DUF4129 domain-containing protein n=1 Tax=Actinomyces timonensis TaxID=1288391 RepID=UPI0003055A03|nr:DUF4129 domain-containing protein [Actinomyces timonensis]
MIALEQAAFLTGGLSGAAGASGPPATPDASQAREAAERELSKPAYAEKTDPLSAAWHWITHHVDLGAMIPGVPPWLSATIVLLALTVLIVVIGAMARRLTIARISGDPRGSLFEDDRDAAALANDADLAADRGDFAAAVVDRFRAIIRSLDERGLLEDYPGLTAHEAAGLAASAIPALATDLGEGARLFDALRYGDVVASPDEDARMRALARAVESQADHARRDAQARHAKRAANEARR